MHVASFSYHHVLLQRATHLPFEASGTRFIFSDAYSSQQNALQELNSENSVEYERAIVVDHISTIRHQIERETSGNASSK